MNKLLALFLLITIQPANAGIVLMFQDEAMIAIPILRSLSDAIVFGEKHKGNADVARELRRVINQNYERIEALLTKDSINMPEQLKAFSKAADIAGKNRIYRKALSIVDPAMATYFIHIQPFKSLNDAIYYGNKNAGDEEVAKALNNIIDMNADRIETLLLIGDGPSLEGAIHIIKVNVLYKHALEATGVGSTFYAGSIPLNKRRD